MEVTISATPPYLPSLEWLIQNGVDSSDSPMKTREYTRTLIESNSPEGMVLTVPVAGGSSAVKRLRPEQLEISAHGDWTRIHLGAIEAAYGREPYFQHFFPGIAGIIADYPPLLRDMNVRLLSFVLSCIGYKENILELEKMKTLHFARYADIRSRMMKKVDPTHSFIEPLFRLGRDALFLL